MITVFKSKEGFTLMEVMFTAALIALAVSGSMGLMDWIVQSAGYNQHLTEATTAAHDAMEDLLAAGFDAATAGTRQEGIYTVTWAVGSAPAGYSGAAVASKELTATVTWANERGARKQVEIKSLVGEDVEPTDTSMGFTDYTVTYP